MQEDATCCTPHAEVVQLLTVAGRYNLFQNGHVEGDGCAIL
jgi:hypothetical protein